MTLQQIVSDYFGDYVGRFLELGANDGSLIEGEPCTHLLEKGWYGLYCEPNPFSLVKLIENTNHYNVDILTAAISTTESIAEFLASESHPYLSSLNVDWVDHCNKQRPELLFDLEPKQYNIFVNTITPTDLFTKFGYDFDLISIDIEMYPPQVYTLLKNMDFEALDKCKMVVVEGNFIYIDEYMEYCGFTKQIINENSVFTR